MPKQRGAGIKKKHRIHLQRLSKSKVWAYLLFLLLNHTSTIANCIWQQWQRLVAVTLFAITATASAGKSFNDQERKASKTIQKKKGRQVALGITKKEAKQPSKKLIKRLTCSSSSKCPYYVKSKAEVHQEFTKTSIIKAILNSIFKDANMILKSKNWVSHII